MEFTLDDDQDDAAADRARASSSERAVVLRARDGGRRRRGFTDALWDRMVELGWLGLLVPEAQGGLGLGLRRDGGRARGDGTACRSPVRSSRRPCSPRSRRGGLGLDDRLASLASGADPRHGRASRRRATATWSTASPHPRRRASRGQWRLTGHQAGRARRPHRRLGARVARAPSRASAPSWSRRPGPSSCPGAGRDPQGRPPRASTASRPSPSVPTAIRPRSGSASSTTPASRCAPRRSARCSRRFDLAVEYAKVRVQFDRPIATFQAIKHKAAEMLAAPRAGAGRHPLRGVGLRRRRADVRAEAAAMAKAFVGRGRQRGVRREPSRSTAASASPGTATPTSTTARPSNDLLLGYQGWQRQRLADLVLGRPHLTDEGTSGPAHNTTPVMDGPRRRWTASSSSKVLVTSFVLRPCQRRRMARPLPAERYEPAH